MSNYAIIPRPVSIEYLPGSLQNSGIPRIAHNGDFQKEANVFTDQICAVWGDGAFIHDDMKQIRLLKNENLTAKESYRLAIRPDEICVSAANGTGIYRGLQTLRQLLLDGDKSAISIPCGIIDDKPRFSWRGFMLDCSRYFYTVNFIKHLLDALSLQHINIFHWHLTDDQGWRLPVRQYPLLTEIGSKRKDRRRGEYIGGFYTESEIMDIVAFAADRHIEVVPEIDLPGHTSAILAAYPNLGCKGGPYHVEDRFGIFNDVLCAGNDAIFPLIEAVFDTLGELFPSKHVHIGGDEVRFKRWAQCPKCRKRMDELKLNAPAQLQSWITARLTHMLQQRGKTAIGWDEVLEHTNQFPLPKDLIIMSWRGQEGGSKATAQGHHVIMTPLNNGCYLNFKNSDDPEEPGDLGINTIEQGYHMEAVTPEMDSTAAALVLGGQGNLWSEVIYAGKIAEYMIFPRICAIAETLWSDKKTKNIEDFYQRLSIHQRRLDKLGLLQYRK